MYIQQVVGSGKEEAFLRLAYRIAYVPTLLITYFYVS